MLLLILHHNLNKDKSCSEILLLPNIFETRVGKSISNTFRGKPSLPSEWNAVTQVMLLHKFSTFKKCWMKFTVLADTKLRELS